MAIAEQRELLKLIESVGLEIVDQARNGPRLKMQLRAPDGRQRQFIFSLTAGDWRARKNDEAAMRRFLNEGAPKEELRIPLAKTAVGRALAEALQKADEAQPPQPQPEPEPEPLPAPVPEPQPETKEIAPMNTAAPAKRMRNQLDAASQFKFYKWFSEQPDDVVLRLSREEVARRAEEALQIPITEGNVAGAETATGRPRVRYAPPASLVSRVAELEAKVAELTQRLDALRK